MKTHIVFGDAAAGNLRLYLNNYTKSKYEIIKFHDDLSVGPIKSISSQSRIKWLKNIFLKCKLSSIEDRANYTDDTSSIKALSKIKNTIHIWLAPIALDELTLMRIADDLLKLQTEIYLIQVRDKADKFAGEYTSLGSIKTNATKMKRFVKNRQKITINYLEKLIAKWKLIRSSKAFLRNRIGAFTFQPLPQNHFDAKILQKASTFITPISIFGDFCLPTYGLNFEFIVWRIQELIKKGKLEYQGDPTTSRQYLVKFKKG